MRNIKSIISLMLLLLYLLWALQDIAAETVAQPEAEQKEKRASVSQTPYVLQMDIIDRTAGQSLPKALLETIKNEVVKQIKSKYPTASIVSTEAEKTSPVLRVYVDVFTAGNRALRFWVGFGVGKAHLKITAEWLENGQVKDSQMYQRFGAGSLRTGETIEMQMTEMIARYSVEFLSAHIMIPTQQGLPSDK